MSALQHSSPLAYIRSCIAIFVVNATLVASQWQDHMWSFPLHPPVNTEQKTGKTASATVQVFGMTQLEIEPSVPALVHVLNHLYHLASYLENISFKNAIDGMPTFTSYSLVMKMKLLPQ